MGALTIEQAHGLARGHLQAGRLADVEAICRAVLDVAPRDAEAHRLLGTVAYYAGKPTEAVSLLQRAVALNPAEAEYRDNLAVLLNACGRHGEAEAEARQALTLRPGYSQAVYNLGVALLGQGRGRLEEAARAFRLVLSLHPDHAEAANNLANVLLSLGRPAEAELVCRRALALRPVYAQAEYNLGTALQRQGRLEEAALAFRRAQSADPGMAGAAVCRGNVLQALGRAEDAVIAYREALAIAPDSADAENNQAGVLESLDRLEEAEAAGRRAVALAPGLAEAACTLASTLHAQGRVEEALEQYHRALEIKPDLIPFAHSKALFCEQYRPGVTLAHLADAHARWDRVHALPLRNAWRPFPNTPDPGRPLRLGFVSADFGRHPVGTFLVRTLEEVDRNACHTVGYSDRVHADDLTRRIAKAFGTWRDTHSLDDEALAEQVRADRIDILFDLAGHTGQRLLVFARKPAPLLASWIGYVGTTGLSAMDTLIADRFHVPEGAESYYCERIIRLPDGYVCYDPPAEAPAVGPLPALSNGYVTFGSFNNTAKVNSEVVALWASVLDRVPGSRLSLRYHWLDDARTRRRYIERFGQHGIDASRLELKGRASQAELLAEYNRIDVVLDPFPYSGGLTTCEALWMGVPVVSSPGETFASRHTLSHMANVGLGHLVAHGPESYVATAAEWAGSLEWLSELRRDLRRRVADSPLCDGRRFANNLLAALRVIWTGWCETTCPG